MAKPRPSLRLSSYMAAASGRPLKSRIPERSRSIIRGLVLASTVPSAS
ncbi:Uncharacterised protein [Bordetella pertussis]|nr:Uncharacterised protein [Bordetella pertussis]CFP61198.1 Uncharacterised protein [Bordetella pertussis]CFW30482.1 Uncharacterised protein [Bordetella pertussis]CPM95446.1 Uncharacterised protein [Bordetella pertussis]